MAVERKVPPLPPADVHIDAAGGFRPSEAWYRYNRENEALLRDLRNASNNLEDRITPVAPGNVTGTTYIVGANDTDIVFATSAACTVTLPSPATIRELHVLNTAAFAINSASNNVIQRTGGSPTNVILPATDGAWARLKSNGSNWQKMAGS